MYAVKIYATGVLRSWHEETPSGLQRAIAEADMRTHGFGYAHMVTDNHDLRLYLALPAEVQNKRELEAASTRADRLVAWLAFAMLLVAVFCRR